MPSFNAQETFEPLAYDFAPYAGSGTIPEPSGEQLKAFQKAIGQMAADIVPQLEKVPVAPAVQEGTKLMAQAKAVAALAQDNNFALDIDRKLLLAISDLCSNSPSADDLEKLPYRLQRAFLGWVIGTLFSPEA